MLQPAAARGAACNRSSSQTLPWLPLLGLMGAAGLWVPVAGIKAIKLYSWEVGQLACWATSMTRHGADPAWLVRPARTRLGVAGWLHGCWLKDTCSDCHIMQEPYVERISKLRWAGACNLCALVSKGVLQLSQDLVSASHRCRCHCCTGRPSCTRRARPRCWVR